MTSPVQSTAARYAIDTLIDMAHRGEIDPWDVPVIEVIDHFLQDLGILDSLDLSFQQQNLPRSGQAFLWASLLVRYKADTLHALATAPPEAADTPDTWEEETPEVTPRLPSDLENRLRRRTAVPPLPKRRVTLAELIEQIEAIATELEKQEKRPPKIKRAKPQTRREALQIITELAHQENLTELATQLEDFLHHIPWTATPPGLALESLLTQWHHHLDPHHPPTKTDTVGVFWALLLLSSQSKVLLHQDQFYQDLYIQML